MEWSSDGNAFLLAKARREEEEEEEEELEEDEFDDVSLDSSSDSKSDKSSWDIRPQPRRQERLCRPDLWRAPVCQPLQTVRAH